MPRRKPRNQTLRRAVAVEAARIMTEQGIRNYHQAKVKAARRLGVNPDTHLPKNSEIESALRESLELFGGSEHREHLRNLRESALEAMDFFRAFRPRLVGPVLEGTADQYSEICLQVFVDSPEQFATFLADRNIPHDQEERLVRLERNRDGYFPVFLFEAGNYAYQVTALPFKALRQPPLSPVSGRPMQRASEHGLRDLLSSEPALAMG